LAALFERPTPDYVELTFDTDAAVKANSIEHATGGKRPSASESLMRAIADIRTGAVDLNSLRSLTMSASSLLAATAAFKRAKNTGRLGKGGKGMLKRSTQRTAGILAMRAATSAAVTGALDGVHGADPCVVQTICDRLKSVSTTSGCLFPRRLFLNRHFTICRSLIAMALFIFAPLSCDHVPIRRLPVQWVGRLSW
jgi:hypothetical protein